MVPRSCRKKISAIVRGTRTSTAPAPQPVTNLAAMMEAYNVATEVHATPAVTVMFGIIIEGPAVTKVARKIVQDTSPAI
jgi:hypothetical protein